MSEHRNILHGPNFLFEFPEDTTIGQLMFDQIASYGNKIAQIQQETGEQISFEDIQDKSCKLAVYFRKSGVQVNDRIAICSENHLGWASVTCATLYVGATICPMNPAYSEQEFLHSLNISKPKYLFVSPSAIESVNNWTKTLIWRPIIVLLFNVSSNKIDFFSLDDLIAQIPDRDVPNFEITQVDPESHVVAILCSSGTTGLFKGVMLTDRNYVTNMQAMLDSTVGAITERKVLCLLPFFHAYSFSIFLMGLYAGNTATVFAHFEREAFLEAIQRDKIEILTLVPPLLVFLAKDPMVSNYDLSSVKLIWSGSAALPTNIEKAVKKRLNNVPIRQGYGMTETTLSVLKVPDNCPYKPGSVGKLIPGVSGKVLPVDENGKTSDEPLGPNCEGELCFKGKMIMKGYCGDVLSTAATIDKDGWLHTGDIGYYDKDGFFYIVDRLKELIKYKGYQVPPAELEAILLTHPDIKDAAVVGLRDEEVGELPVAFVVKQPNANITAEDVVKYVDERVSTHKRLRGGVRFLESIPKNPIGKALRKELRALLIAKM